MRIENTLRKQFQEVGNMLGDRVDKDLYKLINKTVVIKHPQDGPVEIEVKDIKGGMVYFETTTGTLSSMPVGDFEKALPEFY